MITSHLMGGLGNQMFQISATTSLAIKNKDAAIFSPRNVGDMKHKLPPSYYDNIYRNINFVEVLEHKSIYKEKEFSHSLIPYTSGMCLYGYFQSEKYFSDDRDYIKELFAIDKKTYDKISIKYGEILEKNETVAIHIRRGDYVTQPNHHPVCTLKYYCDAMKLFPDVTYIIFSDDILWCKLNFPLDQKYIFVEGNKDYEDLYLMSMCDHNIIANSSFSWWAAWLNNNDNKRVVAPKRWFGPAKAQLNTKDLYCEGWVIL